MFRNLREQIRVLNSDISNVANSEKAKELRKKLLSMGLPLAICGFLGAFVCFILFAVFGFKSVNNGGFSAGMLVPFFLIIPFAAVGAVGAMLTNMALSIILTGYTTKVIDETISNVCPECGATVSSSVLYCPKCGAKVNKECPNCGHINSQKHDFCEKCGTKLDK